MPVVTDRPADYIGDEALARVREGWENMRVTPSARNRVASRVFELADPPQSVLAIYGPSTEPYRQGPRLLALKMDENGKLTADYDPADLDAAAQAFVRAVMQAWGPTLAAYVTRQVSRSQVMPSNHNS